MKEELEIKLLKEKKEAYKRECESAYVKTRLKAFKYLGYKKIELKDGVATIVGSNVEPRRIYFLELPEGEHKIEDILNSDQED